MRPGPYPGISRGYGFAELGPKTRPSPRLDPGESCARTQLRHARPGVVGAAAHGARDGTGPQRLRVTPGEPCLRRMSALSRRNWSCGTQSPQRRVGGYRDTDSLFWLWAKANKQRLDLYFVCGPLPLPPSRQPIGELMPLWAAERSGARPKGVNPREDG